MSKIVLVHGALHGAWCWETLTPHLRAHGFDVEAVELPGAGADTTAASDITFDSAVKLVADALHDEPTILLGHSMGGFIASQAAVLAPHHVNNLVLLCAAAPADGETLIDQAKLLQQWHTHSGPDESSILRASREAPSLGLWRDIFYNECSIDIATAAVARFRPTPPAFQQHAISLPADTWSKVSKTYIVCTKDRALPPEHQRQQAGRLPSTIIVEKPWDHSPFYSAPEALTSLLASLDP